MKLYKINLSKAELLYIPEKELEFFIQLMNFFNEANILQKLMVISGNSREEASQNRIVRRSLSSQGLFFMRIQAGKLYEGWNMLDTHFFNNRTFSQEYNEKGSSQSKESLSKLRESFGRGNLLKNIRNIYAFHYSKESSNNMIKQIKNTPDSEKFELYFSEEYGNCFFSISHDLLNSSILEDIEPSNWPKAMNDFFQEILDITAYTGLSGRQFRRHPDIKPEHPDILSIQFLLTLFLINNYHLVHIKLKDLKEFNLKCFTLFSNKVLSHYCIPIATVRQHPFNLSLIRLPE